MSLKVIISSKNPIKIKATESAFKQMLPDTIFKFEGASIPSDVSDQPMTHNETKQGAINRVNNAKIAFPNADFWVGIEGGIEIDGADMECFAWVVVLSKTGQGKAKTASFYLPPKVVELVKQGYELGDADDIVFKQENSKQKSGAAGLLTKNIIHRTTLYEPAVVLALIPFVNEELYNVGNRE